MEDEIKINRTVSINDHTTLILTLTLSTDYLVEQAIVCDTSKRKNYVAGTCRAYPRMDFVSQFAWNDRSLYTINYSPIYYQLVDGYFHFSDYKMHEYSGSERNNRHVIRYIPNPSKKSIAPGSQIFPLGDDRYFVVAFPEKIRSSAITGTSFRERHSYFVTINNGEATVKYFATAEQDFFNKNSLMFKDEFFYNGDYIIMKRMSPDGNGTVTAVLDGKTGEVIKDDGALKFNNMPAVPVPLVPIQEYAKTKLQSRQR